MCVEVQSLSQYRMCAQSGAPTCVGEETLNRIVLQGDLFPVLILPLLNLLVRCLVENLLLVNIHREDLSRGWISARVDLLICLPTQIPQRNDPVISSVPWE